jgi:hypothetical protein
MATDAESTPQHEGDDSEVILRAKYLEYCSAQIADLLLYLSPDEIYLLAEKASREGGRPAAPDRTYSSLVRAATQWLSMRVALPPFEIWRDDFRAHRERYESYLMGLWESDLPTPIQGEYDA